MTLQINIDIGSAVNGGAGIGLMTSANNPWSVPDALAQDLVNRGIATPLNWPAVPISALSPADAQEVAAQLPLLQSVTAPYKLATFGDSRTNFSAAGTQIGIAGSTQAVATAKFPPWTAGYLQDTALCGNYGISGDVLISSTANNGWNGTARWYSKTVSNLIAAGYDAVVIQYGINDVNAGATAANLIAAFKSFVGELLASGLKVCLQGITTFDPTATLNVFYGNAAGASAALTVIQTVNTAMAAWLAPMTGRAVFVDVNPYVSLASGYGDPQYYLSTDNLGLHPNDRGAQRIGYYTAQALRTLLPAKNAKTYTVGPLTNPNLIDWGAAASANVVKVDSLEGTMTGTAPTWNMDSATGVPYAEVILTPTALASGVAAAGILVFPTGVSGATPKWPISVGDVIRAAARVTVDDGAGNLAPGVQNVSLRCRMFNTAYGSQFFNDVNGVPGVGSALSQGALTLPVDCRFDIPVSASPIASANISADLSGVNGGFYLYVTVETTTLAPVRVRLYAPDVRVISAPQPAAITPGASPYVWQNLPQPFAAQDFVAVGRKAMVTVGGGTVSAISIGRGPTVAGVYLNALATGLTSGVFTLNPGDGISVTYSVAPTMTYAYL